MFHNSPQKFPGFFFNTTGSFPMGKFISKISCATQAAATVSNTHGESNQRNHDKDTAARVHPSHDTHDTWPPWAPSTREGVIGGLKCRKNGATSFSKRWINMNQWSFLLPLTSILICFCLRFLFSSPWRVLVTLGISAFVEGHGVGYKNLIKFKESPCAAAFGHLLDKYCKRLFIKSPFVRNPRMILQLVTKTSGIPGNWQSPVVQGTKCPIFINFPGGASSCTVWSTEPPLRTKLVACGDSASCTHSICEMSHEASQDCNTPSRGKTFFFVFAPVCQKLLPLYTCAAMLRYAFNNSP